MIPVIINNRDRLTSTRAMVDYVRKLPEAHIVIIDNASTYPPLLRWYESNPDNVQIIKLEKNTGPYAPWAIAPALMASNYYVVTDSDLDLSCVPVDVLEKLKSGLERFPAASKAGLSLEINDIPEKSPCHSRVQQWESNYWNTRASDDFFWAKIDTTFAMYRPGSNFAGIHNALRADRPYTARHLPWYLTPDTVTTEDVYVRDHAVHGRGWSTVSPLIPDPKDERVPVAVSIAMSTHNKPDYLKRTLHSIYVQHPPFDFEVVVVDDGSQTGETWELCQKYPVVYRRIERAPGWRNPSHARNVAYKISRGNVMILQSDDVIHRDANTIERLVTELKKGEFIIATVYNVHPLTLAAERHPTFEFTGPHNRRPLFFLGSLWREDLFSVGGNDEEFIAPGYEDDWFATCLLRGRALTWRIVDVVGYHQNHPRPHDSLGTMTPSRKLYKNKLRMANAGKIPFTAAGGAWPYK